MTQPKHPVDQLTTSELARYRRELEHAVKALADAPVHAELRRRLDEVLAQQEERAKIARNPSSERV